MSDIGNISQWQYLFNTNLSLQVKKIVLKGVHKSSVTCATWSTNGMKLFTGDDIGSVIYTEVDFYEVSKLGEKLV